MRSLKQELQQILEGPTLLLRPLSQNDFDPLFAAASDPQIWEQHFDPSRYTKEGFQKYFDRGLKSEMAFVIINKPSGHVIGSSRYARLDPEKSDVEIGYTFLIREHWGRGTNSELKQLMIVHAFKFLNTVTLYVSENNFRSQKAVEKLQAKKTELFKGPDHRSFVYKIDKQEWLDRKSKDNGF